MKQWIKVFAVLALSAGSAVMAQTSNFPSKPIKLIVPWGAGSGIDVQVRQYAEGLGKALNTPVVVENKVGAGSQIGYEIASRSPADGYTLLAGTNANFIHQHLQPQAKINPLRDMAPISMMFWMPSVLVVAEGSPVKDVSSMISWLRNYPGGGNFGSGGVGAASHLLAEMINRHNDLKLTHIPLRSLTADLGPMLTKGDIQFAIPVTGVAAAQIGQGNVRPIAVTSSKRLPQWPDVPTLSEAFQNPSYEADSWTALFAPKGTPEPVLEKLHAAAVKASQSAEHIKSAKFFQTIQAHSESRAEFAEFFGNEAEKWGRIAVESKMTNR